MHLYTYVLNQGFVLAPWYDPCLITIFSSMWSNTLFLVYQLDIIILVCYSSVVSVLWKFFFLKRLHVLFPFWFHLLTIEIHLFIIDFNVHPLLSFVSLMTDISHFLTDRFYMNRISIRMLITQHCEWTWCVFLSLYSCYHNNIVCSGSSMFRSCFAFLLNPVLSFFGSIKKITLTNYGFVFICVSEDVFIYNYSMSVCWKW